MKIRKDPAHWVTVAVLIALGVFIGEWLGSHRIWIKLRYKLYQSAQRFNPRETYPKRTALVLIGDEEYWKGELAHRSPIKRDYLARLIRALDKAGPEVIALDFDLRLRVPNGSLPEHSDYAKETGEFLATVREVSQRRTIVLARTIGRDREGRPVSEAAIYDGFDFQGGDVRSGYIELPYDLRQVPMPLKLHSGPLDSFSVAIVRPLDPHSIHVAEVDGSLPYGTFIEHEHFSSLPASEVLSFPGIDLRRKLRNKVVIIGAAWSKFAYKRGELVDSDDTPIGKVGNVFMHANYAEALLDQRTYRPLDKTVVMWLEILLSFGVAVLFSIETRKFLKGVVVVCALLGAVFANYVLWQNLGLFFDFFIPLVLLIGHALVEQVAGWREAAHSKGMEWKRSVITAHP